MILTLCEKSCTHNTCLYTFDTTNKSCFFFSLFSSFFFFFFFKKDNQNFFSFGEHEKRYVFIDKYYFFPNTNYIVFVAVEVKKRVQDDCRLYLP